MSLATMGRSQPVDNSNEAGKLLLRRTFLTQYHAGTRPVVFDCCQGEGRLWTTLRREFTVTYWGVDQKRRAGRLAIDSSRLLRRPRLPYDVIDIDTYGSPWIHWAALVRNVVKPTTVFLTIGRSGPMTAVGSIALETLGLAGVGRLLPRALVWKLDELSLESFLSPSYISPLQIIDCREVIPESTGARYFGVRLQPATIEGHAHV